ncbi:hypothetical protein TL18_05390 [Methanobrevibacter sp. YE315]|uniref:hypothetical protein n=1 Tax=Methanobrevibacter sp. YE315 TaxID=1609968 RepID=UPI000764D1DE|nr:hypothetical protein [Methanobrevibacter sp. YE315]AMD17502.1 hypothetical protein TL18_05390 [Methanobrevibacter sp. YE315]
MDEDVTTVHMSKTLTSAMIVDLIEKYPSLVEITCPPSVYDRTSSTYIDALSELHIKVKKKYNWGAKSKTNGAEFEVLRLSNEGLSAKEISQEMGITLNRVYYLLKKSDATFDNRKRKHDHSEVKRLQSEGLSAKQIAEKLDMPLRSVYYILNKK